MQWTAFSASVIDIIFEFLYINSNTIKKLYNIGWGGGRKNTPHLTVLTRHILNPLHLGLSS